MAIIGPIIIKTDIFCFDSYVSYDSWVFDSAIQISQFFHCKIFLNCIIRFQKTVHYENWINITSSKFLII